MATAPTEAGQITVGKFTLAQPYIGVRPLGMSSQNEADAEAKVTLNADENTAVYLCGVIVTGSGADVANVVEVTITGLESGPRRFIYGFEEGPAKINQPLILTFIPPLAATDVDTPVVISCPPSGAGGLNNVVTAWGFASTVG
jgi:hypothetical protein